MNWSFDQSSFEHHNFEKCFGVRCLSGLTEKFDRLGAKNVLDAAEFSQGHSQVWHRNCYVICDKALIRKSSHGGLGLASLKTIILFGILVLSFPLSAAVNAVINNQGETVHLEFEGQSQWDYDLKKVEQKTDQKNKQAVQLTIPALTEASLKELRAFSSPLVKSIEVDTKGADGKYVLTFQLSRSDIEPFDYLTEKPSKLIIDFFKSTGPAKAEKETEPVDETPTTVVEKKNSPAKASTKGQDKEK